MNTILEKTDKMPFFTDLRVIFDALNGRQNEFKWLITDLECNHHPDPRLPYTGYRGKPIVISGDQLTEIVYNHDIQFIWAVLSGLKPDEPIDVNELEVVPYADGNPDFWTNPPQVQHPKAIVEIVCWDSSLVLLLSKDDDLSNRFRSYFPEAKDLDEYNDVPVYDIWLKKFIAWSEVQLPIQQFKEIQSKYDVGQYKLAFHRLIVALTTTGEYPYGFYFPRWKETALYYELDSDEDIWRTFEQWGQHHKD